MVDHKLIQNRADMEGALAYSSWALELTPFGPITNHEWHINGRHPLGDEESSSAILLKLDAVIPVSSRGNAKGLIVMQIIDQLINDQPKPRKLLLGKYHHFSFVVYMEQFSLMCCLRKL